MITFRLSSRKLWLNHGGVWTFQLRPMEGWRPRARRARVLPVNAETLRCLSYLNLLLLFIFLSWWILWLKYFADNSTNQNYLFVYFAINIYLFNEQVLPEEVQGNLHVHALSCCTHSAGPLPLNDTIGEQWGTPLDGGCPRGHYLDLGRGQSRGRSRMSSQLSCGPCAATVEAGAGFHANGVGCEGMQAMKSLLGGHAFR